ncbi:MAG: substrate-binding domain-containing protein [Cyanobacteria bacterium P01_A01_bin.68]
MRICNLLGFILGSMNLVFINGCNSGSTNSIDVAKIQQQEIQIASSSSTYLATKILTDSYQAKNSASQIKLLPPSQSESAIAGVKQRILDIGSVSRKLKPKEDDGSVKYTKFATDALTVATHPSVKGVKNLNTSQLKAIYSGKITNWKQLGGTDAQIVLLDRPEDESAKKLLRQYYLGKNLKSSPNAVILRQEPELINSVENTPYSIGAFSLGYTISNQSTVNRLSLNGIEPTIENVKAGKYSMVRHLGVVHSKTPSKETQYFLDFIFSKQGKESLKKSGFLPSK